MALISFKDTPHYLETGKPPWPPIFLLYGEEVLYKKVLDRLLQALLGQASRTVNYEPLEGVNENVPMALAAVNTYALLAEPKVVALTDARLFLSAKNEKRLWQKAYDAAGQDHPEQAARHLRDGLSLRRLAWEDLEREDDWQVLLGVSPGGGDWSWARPVVAYCRENNLGIPQASDPAQALEAAVANGFPNHHHLIITTPWIDKRRRLFQILKDRGLVIDCSVPGGERQADRAAQAAVLDATVDDVLAGHQKTMGREARRRLYRLTGFDLRTVITNVEQLVNFSGDRHEIVRDDVRRVLSRTRRDPLYEFTNAVTDRHRDKALFFLQSLLNSGAFDHPLPLLAAVGNQIRKLIVAQDFARSRWGQSWRPGCSYAQFQQRVLPDIKAYDAQLLEQLTEWQKALQPVSASMRRGQRASPRKVTSDLLLMGRGRSPYPVYRILTKSEHFTHRELLDALAAISQADRRLKRSGPGGRLILEQVIMGICRRANAANR
jgi:DNA polymerase-3 subunit delta